MATAESWHLYRRLLGYARPYWRVIVVALVSMVIYSATEPALPALMQPLVDGGLIDRDPQVMLWVPLALIGVFLVRGLASYGSTVASQWVAQQTIADLRAHIFRRLLEMPAGEFVAQSGGVLISKVTYDVQQVADAVSKAWVVLVRDSLIIVGLLGYMAWTSWQLTLVMLVVTPLVAWIIRRVSGSLRASSQGIQQAMGEMTHGLEEALGGHREVRIYGGQDYERRRFADVVEDARRETLRVTRITAANLPVIQVVIAVSLAGVVYVALQMSAAEELAPGEFVSFVTAMSLLFEPIRHLTQVNTQLQRGLAAAESAFELMDRPAETDEGDLRPERIEGGLRFENLGFRYPGAARPALEGVNLEVAPGTSVALVGQSGSGKTTLAHLVPRLLEPTEGRILVDGHDIRSLPRALLRRHIAYVGQQVVLFNDTVRANIAYGELADAPEQDIIAAARSAHAWEFIQEMPEGLDAPVGQNGSRLSGGQRQRIAIARAFLKDAPILILDEATSALDTESESYIQDAIANLTRARTTLVIAHRLSTIEHADQIAVMAQGRIIETGRHDELIRQGGAYARLYELQFSTERAAAQP